MRCRACDKTLTDFESTRRSATTGLFLDLCGFCLAAVVDIIPTKENWNVFDGGADDIVSVPTVDDTPSKGHGPDSDDLADDGFGEDFDSEGRTYEA